MLLQAPDVANIRSQPFKTFYDPCDCGTLNIDSVLFAAWAAKASTS